MIESPNYKQLFSLVDLEGTNLVFDFSRINFLSVFEITELFAYCTEMCEFNSFEIRAINEVSDYLTRVNFFHQLAQVKKLKNTLPSSFTGSNQQLLELNVYEEKNRYYAQQDSIFSILGKFGLDASKTSRVIASLSEVVDNTFSHNLGKWNSKTGPLAICLIQTYKSKKQLLFSFCDFGGGFQKSLSSNYPELLTEADAINKAIKPNVTGRPTRKGGNGLDYLQRNTFNGFKGDLLIRSTDTLVKISSYQTTEVIETKIPLSSGTNICFSLLIED